MFWKGIVGGCRGAIRARGGSTYAHGFIDGLAVGVVVLAMSVSALLAGRGGAALSSSSRC